MISSRSNPTIKRIRALRHRKEREASGRFFVEGIRLVGEAIELTEVETVVVAPDLLTSEFGRRLADRARSTGVETVEVTGDVFRSISTKEGPQGLGAVVAQKWTRLPDVHPEKGLCWITLDEVADPGNLGAILRTADAVGAAGVILSGHTTDPHDPEAVRASMGAIFGLSMVRASFEELLAWTRSSHVALVGTSDAAATEYRAVRYPFPLVLLMGSERQGLTLGQQQACDLVVRIPMVGRGDSLNVAVATAVVLYEIFHQRHAPVT